MQAEVEAACEDPEKNLAEMLEEEEEKEQKASRSKESRGRGKGRGRGRGRARGKSQKTESEDQQKTDKQEAEPPTEVSAKENDKDKSSCVDLDVESQWRVEPPNTTPASSKKKAKLTRKKSKLAKLRSMSRSPRAVKEAHKNEARPTVPEAKEPQCNSATGSGEDPHVPATAARKRAASNSKATCEEQPAKCPKTSDDVANELAPSPPADANQPAAKDTKTAEEAPQDDSGKETPAPQKVPNKDQAKKDAQAAKEAKEAKDKELKEPRHWYHSDTANTHKVKCLQKYDQLMSFVYRATAYRWYVLGGLVTISLSSGL